MCNIEEVRASSETIENNDMEVVPVSNVSPSDISFKSYGQCTEVHDNSLKKKVPNNKKEVSPSNVLLKDVTIQIKHLVPSFIVLSHFNKRRFLI